MIQTQNTDNMIIMRLVKMTKSGGIKWYLETENKGEGYHTKKYEADVAITKSKKLTFKFFHNLNDTQMSWLGIYIYKNHKFDSSVRVIDGRKFKFFNALYRVIKSYRGEEE